MNAGADLDAELPHRFGCGAAARDRGRGLAEAGEEPVAGRVELPASEPLELAPNDAVVPVEQRLPAPISELFRD